MSTNLRLLIFAAAVAAFFFGSDALLRHSSSFWTFSQRYAFTEQTAALGVEARLATMEPGRVDVAVVGSSVGEAGVDAFALSQELGRLSPKIEKLALPASQAIETAMLTSLIERAHPEVVIYPLTIWGLQDHIDWEVVRFYDPAVALELFDWSEIARDHDYHASGLLKSWHVAVRHRDALRRTFGMTATGRWKGGNEAPPKVLFADVIDRAQKRNSRSRRDFHCPSVQTRALDVFGRRLRDAGIQLIVVATPVASKWQRDQTLLRTMDSCMRAAAEQGDYRYVPSTEIPAMEPGDFRDSLHLSESGRGKFTHALANVLQAPLHALRVREKRAVR